MNPMEVELDALRQQVAAQQATIDQQKKVIDSKEGKLSLTIYSSCGITTKNGEGKPVQCKVNNDTLKCEHGANPKGNLAITGLQQFPVSLWGKQWLRALPFITDVLIPTVQKHPEFFQREKVATK